MRKPRYLAAFAAIGCASNMAKAQVCELDPKSIYSALEGQQVGPRFQVRTILTLRKPEYAPQLRAIGIEPTLDSLFEVSDGVVA